MGSGAAGQGGQGLPSPSSARFWPAMPGQSSGCPLGAGIRSGTIGDVAWRAALLPGPAPGPGWNVAVAAGRSPSSGTRQPLLLGTDRARHRAQAESPARPGGFSHAGSAAGISRHGPTALVPCPVGVNPQRVFVGSWCTVPGGSRVPSLPPGSRGTGAISQGFGVPRESCLSGLGRRGRIHPRVICCPS